MFYGRFITLSTIPSSSRSSWSWSSSSSSSSRCGGINRSVHDVVCAAVRAPPHLSTARDRHIMDIPGIFFFLSSSSSSSFISIIPLALQSLSSGCNSIPYYSEEGEKAEEREENKSSIAAVCSCDHHHIHDDITVVRPIRWMLDIARAAHVPYCSCVCVPYLCTRSYHSFTRQQIIKTTTTTI